MVNLSKSRGTLWGWTLFLIGSIKATKRTWLHCFFSPPEVDTSLPISTSQRVNILLACDSETVQLDVALTFTAFLALAKWIYPPRFRHLR